MNVKSAAFEDGGRIPDRFGGSNENVNPPLEFKDIPENAESLVLIVDDPDAEAVVGYTFDHWVVYDIPADKRKIAEDSVPEGSVQGSNDASENRYYGPKPPDQEHTYFFKLYALDSELNLGPGATKKEVEDAMEGYVIEDAEMKGRYSPEQN